MRSEACPESRCSSPRTSPPGTRGQEPLRRNWTPSVPRELPARLAAPLRPPHLSIARVRRSGDVDEVVAAVAPLLPLTVHLDTVEVTRRDPKGWTTILRATLG